MPSLESGNYILNFVNFRPDSGDAEIFPLGPISLDPFPSSPLNFLRSGDPASVCRLEKLENGNYHIFYDNRHATPHEGKVFVSPAGVELVEWKIVQFPPSPPPIGDNNFGITAAHDPQQSWLIKSTVQNTYVYIDPISSSIYIVKPDDD